MKNLLFSSQAATCINTREFYKPNEDYYINDVKNGVFIVADGVTRNHEEYIDTKESAAEKVSHIFAETVHENILKNCFENLTDTEILDLLFLCVKEGNKKIKEYNSAKTLEYWEYYPATVGIVAIILNNKLYYVYSGDCLGFLFRNNTRLLFAEQQTKHLNFYKKQLTKKERYENNCNNKDSRLAYGVFNGEDAALDLVKSSYIDLNSGDTIVISSDGLENYFLLENPNDIIGLTSEEIFEKSKIYDRKPYSPYADDKTFIMISVK